MLAQQSPVQPALAEAYAHCRRIALGHYENFPVVSWLLPRRLRRHVYAVYAYCRGVDDIGDEAPGDRLALLDDWERELGRCYAGRPSGAAFVALAHTIRRFGLPREPFLRLIDANRRDQVQSRYETFGELLDYCSYSAQPVGRIILHLFGYTDEARARLSDATCTALQLTNFWQDVAHDYDAGRIYIPLEDMRRFGVTEGDLAARPATPQFRRLMRFQVKRTRTYFRQGLPLIDSVGGRFRLDLRLFTLGGLAVLDGIRRNRYDVLSSRPVVSRSQRAWLALRGLLPLRVRA